MATTDLFMDLSLASSWISADQQDSTISGAFEQKQDNLPKVIWGMNMIPFTAGVKSLTPSQDSLLAPLPVLVSDNPLYTLEPAIDTVGTLHYLLTDDTLTGTKKRYSHNAFLKQWRAITSHAFTNAYFHTRQTVFQNETVYAFVNQGGTPEEFDAGVGLLGDAPSGSDVFLYHDTAHQATVFNLTGINLDLNFGFQGITSHQNFLLFWDFERLYWSSPTDFTDFTPAIGGGGSTLISEARGNILTIVPNSTGLMIYCKNNIVHASFSGDASNPWIFVEVAGSEGVLVSIMGQPLVTSNEASPVQLAVTPTGIVSVSDNGVEPLTMNMLEMYDDLAVETKDVGSVDFGRKFYDYTGELLASTKIYNLKLIGRELFIMSGKSSALADNAGYLDGRLHILNLRTGKIAMIEGRMQMGCGHVAFNRNHHFDFTVIATHRGLVGLDPDQRTVFAAAADLDLKRKPLVSAIMHFLDRLWVGLVGSHQGARRLSDRLGKGIASDPGERVIDPDNEAIAVNQIYTVIGVFRHQRQAPGLLLLFLQQGVGHFQLLALLELVLHVPSCLAKTPKDETLNPDHHCVKHGQSGQIHVNVRAGGGWAPHFK